MFYVVNQKKSKYIHIVFVNYGLISFCLILKENNEQVRIGKVQLDITYIKLDDVNIAKMKLDLMQEFDLIFAYWFGAFGASTIIQNCTNQIHHLLSLAKRCILERSCTGILSYFLQISPSKDNFLFLRPFTSFVLLRLQQPCGFSQKVVGSF